MMELIKKRKSALIKKLMFAYVTGITFVSTTTSAHAEVGELFVEPVNKLGSEVDTALLPIAILIVIVGGTLLLLQKKKLAGAVFIVGVGAILIIKNRNTIGGFLANL